MIDIVLDASIWNAKDEIESENEEKRETEKRTRKKRLRVTTKMRDERTKR